MRKITLLGAAALSLGLACQAAAQKQVEYIGPPIREDTGQPKGGKEKEKKPRPVPQTPPQTGPQSGQAVGFGVGRPGATSPDTRKPSAETPEKKEKPASKPAPAAEVNRPASASVKKKLMPRKKVRARRVKKG